MYVWHSDLRNQISSDQEIILQITSSTNINYMTVYTLNPNVREANLLNLNNPKLPIKLEKIQNRIKYKFLLLK